VRLLSIFGQLARFGGAGSVSAVAHYGLLILLVQVFRVAPVLASAAGALLGAVVNYSLNYRYTFNSSKRHTEAMAKFAVIAAGGLILNTLSMLVAVDLLAFHYLLAQVGTTGLVFIWSFLGNRCWTFHAPREPGK